MRASLLIPLVVACGGREPTVTRDALPARVILITCDTLRADHLGLYGYPRPTSPALDAFAEDAVVYDDAWSAASMTLPALSSLFTARTVDELGVGLSNQLLLAAEVETLPERLSRAGVETAAVVSNAVLSRLPAAVDAPGGEVGIGQGFAHYDDRMDERELHRPTFERSAPETTRAAIEWLDGREDPERGFFLWVHYVEPHGPYTSGSVPERASALPAVGGDGRELTLGTTDSGRGQIPRYQVLDGLRTPEAYRERYDAEIRYLDAAIGDLLDHLRTVGLYDEALIVFSADHGESLGEHDYWFSHGETVYRELVQVPLVIRAPAAPRTRGERRSELMTYVDLHDLILGAFGLERPRSEPRGETAIAVHSCGRPGSKHHWVGVADGNDHLILRADGSRELYDLRHDPREERDLAGEEPARAESLHRRYVEFLAAQPEGVPQAIHVSELVREAGARRAEARRAEAMRALGYGGGDGREED